MPNQSELKIKLILLADGLKQGLANAKQGIDNLKNASNSSASGSFAEAMAEKIKLAEAEIKKAIEELVKLKQAANGKTGALADSLAQEISKAEAKIKSAEAEVDKLKGKLNSGTGGGLSASASKELSDIGKSAGALGGTIDRTMGDIKSTIASAFAVGALIAFTHKLVDTVQRIQDLRIRLSGLTTSANDYAASEAYLIDLAGRHHKSLNDLTKSYSAMLTLEQSGIITRQQSMQLLEGFSNLASKTGASNVQMEQSLYGLSQALGSGNVIMQDFRQIVEPMPGLAEQIARSMDMTIGQLREKIASGTLTSDEFGKHMVQALKSYDGAAARSAGTISATYNDISNAYIAMAKELEKPVASGVLAVADVAKKAYTAIKDNGDAITAVGVVMVSKGVSALAIYTKAGIDAIHVERAHTAAIIENEQRTVSAIARKVSAVETKAAERKVTADLAKTELVAANATLELARANELASGSAAMLVDAERAQAIAAANATKAAGSQAAADTFLGAQKARLTEANLALTAATNASGVAMTRLKSAIAFVGGPVGVAVIALYGLYEILEKINNTEGKAEQKANDYADALKAIDEQVKAMSAEEVKLNTDKAQQATEELRKKIVKLEEFNLDNVLNFNKNADKRAVLLDDLKLMEDKLKALNTQDIELIKNFDATAVPIKELPAALDNATKNANLFATDIERLNTKLHKTGSLSLYEQKQLNEDKLRLNAWEAQESALQKQLELSSGEHQDAMGKKARAAAKERLKAVEDEIKDITSAREAERAQETQAVQAQLAQRKADIALMCISEVQKEQLVTQATKAAQDTQLMIAKSAGADKIKTIDEVFTAKLNAEEKGVRVVKVGSSEEANINKEALQLKLTVYNAQAKNYGEMINQLVAEEVRLTQESLRLTNERKGIEQSYEDFKRQLHQVGLSDAQKNVEDIAQLRKLSSERDTAIRKGDFDTASELDKKILELGKQVALSEKSKVEDAKKSGQYYAGSVEEVVKLTDKAQANILKTNSEAQSAVKSSIDATKSSADAAKTELERVQGSIAEITKTLQEKYALKIDADTKEIDDAIKRITQPTSSVHTVHVVEVKDGGGDTPAAPVQKANGGIVGQYADGGEVFKRKEGAVSGKGTGTSDEIPAMLSNGEYVVKADKVKQFGVAAFDSINYGNKSPDNVRLGDNGVKKYASGGAVGDDALIKKIAELQKTAKDEAFKYFDSANVQFTWTQNGSNKPILDPVESRNNFDSNADRYLRDKQLPPEWLQEYHRRLELSKATATGSIADKAKAMLEFEALSNPAKPEKVNNPITVPALSPVPAIPERQVAPPPVLPVPNMLTPLTPVGFMPQISPRGVTVPQSAGAGIVHTIQLQTDTGKKATVTGGVDSIDFFKQLETISGVTKL